jgi:restriction system protein
LTFFQAALKVLADADGGPLHYREITLRALDKGYIQPTGRTPEATIGAILYTHIKKKEAAGLDPEVKQVGKGKFTLLKKKAKKKPLVAIDENNNRIRKELFERISQLHPRAFENFIGELLSNLGFENVVVLKYVGDQGLDVEAELTLGGVTNIKTAVQVKRWKNNVPGKIIRELRGGLKTDQRGLVITTSKFTRDALREATEAGKTPISLVDGEKLIDLLIENEIGIKKKIVSFFELDLEKLDEYDEEYDSAQGKYLALWPLPGGSKNYVKSAEKILKFIAQAEPSQEQLTEWMIKSFEKLESRKTIGGYIQVLKNLDLIYFDGEEIKVTEDGSEVLTKESATVIFNQLKLKIVGISEFLEELDKSPLSLEEAHSFFKEKLMVDWETDTQTRFRISWLENVGAIKRVGEEYKLGDIV